MLIIPEFGSLKQGLKGRGSPLHCFLMTTFWDSPGAQEARAKELKVRSRERAWVHYRKMIIYRTRTYTPCKYSTVLGTVSTANERSHSSKERCSCLRICAHTVLPLETQVGMKVSQTGFPVNTERR